MQLFSKFKSHTMKGFGIGDIGPVALAMGMAIIVVGMVTLILSNMKSNVTDPNATSVLTKGLEAMVSFAGWFNIIIIAVVAVIVLGLIMMLGRQGNQSA